MSISTVPIARFYPEVKSLTSGALDPFVKEAVLRSLQRFCKEGWAWEADADSIDLLAGVSDYDLELPMGSYAVNLFVYYRGGRLLPIPLRDLAATESGEGIRSGAPTGYQRQANASIRLDRVPSVDENNALRVVAFLQPTEDCEEVPDELWHEWREGVVAGAVSFLKAQKGRPWFDPESQTYYQQQHARDVEASRVRVLRRHSDTQLRVHGRRII